ncbi:MAG: diguanylate cyclase [Firmicutes bacterium]|nr:diguanylate cyclase [Bacillota bacterium]
MVLDRKKYQLLADLPLIIYVSDLQTRRILFFSAYAEAQLGLKVGQICHQSIYGNKDICRFCTSSELLDAEGRPKGVIISEIYNPRLKQWFESRSRAVWWNGRLARFDLAIDISDRVRLHNIITPKDEYYAAILKSVGDGVIVTDQEGKITWMNPVAQDLTSWSLKQAQGLALEDVFHIVHTKTKERCSNLAAKVLKQGRVVGLANHTSLLAKNGKEYQIADSAAPIRDDQGNILGLILVFHDVSEEYHRREELKRSEARFRGLFQRSLNAIALHEIICDQGGKPVDYKFLVVNPAFEELTGLKGREIAGKRVSQVLPGIKKTWIEKCGQVALRGCSLDLEDYSGDLGKHYSVRVFSPQQGLFVTVFQDISARKEMEERLNRLVYQDSLTGLYNRRYFQQQLERLGSDGDSLPLSIIIGDVNGLKIINDSLGHLEGDQVLKSIARVMRAVSRGGDIVARWGGDEFAMLLPRTGLAEAEEICALIEKENLKINTKGPAASIGLGAVCKTKADEDIFELVKIAENRMYRHKMITAQSSRSALVTSLQRTLSERSYETEEHARNMESLALDLGREVGLSDSELNTLSLVALLHDIGKVAVPESILNKPGPLTENEWETMRQHAESGYRILASCPELLDVAEGVLYHHERWDGSGYPHGLRGREIPLIARIVSLVDAYDAMISGRPYRSKITPGEALEEIKAYGGSQFDPRLTEIFLKMMGKRAAPPGPRAK